ncbi:MAG: hypothetical protein QOF96_3987 [Actinomycetota bacterium]|jgi:hypothetical protein|nr:hypothetical protein [Actinomycetota bacterium]MDQ1569107.1 hypothetical protein [Actinomycetota bacterium]
MATIEDPPNLLTRFSPLRIFGWMSFFCLLFVIAFAAVVRPRLRGELLALVIGAVVLAFAVFMICLWVAAWLDTSSFSAAAWERSGHIRWVWTGITIFLWPIGSLLWFAAVRPQIARAEQVG